MLKVEGQNQVTGQQPLGLPRPVVCHPGDGCVLSHLKLRRGEDTVVRRRVLYANGEPTQIADSYYPWSVAKGSAALLREDAGKGGSYSRLAELGHEPVRFTEDVTVRMPIDAEQRTLELEASQPVFEIWHVANTATDRPVEVCIHVMPGHLWTLRYDWDDVRVGEPPA